jgi:hypothetical protein
MADRTPEETQALALERVVNCLTEGWALNGPLLGGLDIDRDRDIFDELERIWDGLKTGSAANPTPTMAWQAVTGGGFPSWSWWHSFNYGEDGTSWEVPGSLKVIAEDPSNERKTVSKTLTALDLLHAYKAMPNKTHCGGCDIIGDPDDCSSDLILQWAMYGEIVYG